MKEISQTDGDFAVIRAGARMLHAPAALIEPLRAAALDTPEGWTRQLEKGRLGPGRGRTQRLQLTPGSFARLKQMRRGGALGGLWRHRFLGRTRLLRTIENPQHLAARGIPTARPLALLTVAGPPLLYRGWVAYEELEHAVDLNTLLGSSRPPTDEEWRVVFDAIRTMHDRGIDHRDLNLGNVLLGRNGPRPAVYFVDLDRLRVLPTAVSSGRRRRALRRLERSATKHHGAVGLPPGGDPVAGYELYAQGDDRLLRCLQRWRALFRLRIGIHRAFWR